VDMGASQVRAGSVFRVLGQLKGGRNRRVLVGATRDGRYDYWINDIQVHAVSKAQP
jgi:hypothetical protein